MADDYPEIAARFARDTAQHGAAHQPLTERGAR